MTIYVDLLFGLNTAINFLLLRGSAAMGGCPAAMGRLLGAACLGGLYAVAAVVPGLEVLQGYLFQLLCAGLMLLLAFGWKQYTLRQGLYFFALSFAFGGAVFLLVQWVEPDCRILGGRAYYAISMSALLLLAALCYGLAALLLTGWGAHAGGGIQTMELQLGSSRRTIRVLRDTGNTLRDPISGRSVLVAGRSLAESLWGKELPSDPAALLQTLARRHPELRPRLVPYHGVGVERGLLPAVRSRLTRGKRTELVLTAFSPTEVGQEGNFDAIWGGELV